MELCSESSTANKNLEKKRELRLYLSYLKHVSEKAFSDRQKNPSEIDSDPAVADLAEFAIELCITYVALNCVRSSLIVE